MRVGDNAAPTSPQGGDFSGVTHSTSQARYRRAIDIERVDRKHFLVNDWQRAFPSKRLYRGSTGETELSPVRAHSAHRTRSVCGAAGTERIAKGTESGRSRGLLISSTSRIIDRPRCYSGPHIKIIMGTRASRRVGNRTGEGGLTCTGPCIIIN